MAKSKRKPHANSYENLDKSQKKYIEKKVKSLGSMEAVETFYVVYGTSKLDLVCRFARSIGKKLYKGKEKK